jgi:tetratricopeptide (TPR) repeat protein
MMDTENLDETMPTPVGDETIQTTPVSDPASPEPEKTSSKRSISWLVAGFVAVAALVFFVALGAFLGYRQGIKERTQFEVVQVESAVQEQYDLGVQDIEAGRYEIARQRFEYVLENDPNYPGVTDRMAEVLLILNATATPTAVPPTLPPTEIPLTPTPDLRGEAELFNHAENLIADRQWTEAIEVLETLRMKNPEYRAIDVDGMFFVAYRNRGAENIGAGNLEEGIYDLTMAEQFGVLDTQANGYRTWARYYLTGASFWGLDWKQAIYYFEQVAAQYPNMHDGTGWTASQRYIEALAGYADWLGSQGKWCGAEEYYNAAYELSGNEAYREARDIASDNCN